MQSKIFLTFSWLRFFLVVIAIGFLPIQYLFLKRIENNKENYVLSIYLSVASKLKKSTNLNYKIGRYARTD